MTAWNWRCERPVRGRSVANGWVVALVLLSGLAAVHRLSGATATGDGPPVPPPRGSGPVAVVAVGDVMLDRGVWGKIQANGAASILAKAAPLLTGADLRFCNLECPLSDSGPRAPMQLMFRADPAAVDVLKRGGIDVVSLANNHTRNSGKQALYNTIDVLDANGIKWAGALGEYQAEPAPTRLTVGSLDVGFLAYTQFPPSDALINERTLDDVCAQVREAAEACELLFVSVHWGDEYRREPTGWQVRWGHALVDSGADVVLGHHPHVLEGVEVYRGKVICYSLGNFVFDQRDVEAMESAVFRVEYLPGTGLQVVVRPVWIPRATFAPEPCLKERGRGILERVRRLSADLGTQMLWGDGELILTVYE